MALLVIVGLYLIGSSLPYTETLSYGVALALSLVLLWGRAQSRIQPGAQAGAQPGAQRLAVPRALAHLLVFPLLLLCVMLHGVYNHPLPDFLKDCWYFTLPVVYLAVGYLVYERVGQWQRLLQPMVLAGTAIAVLSLVHAALNREALAAASSVDAYREITGTGTFVPMVPLILVLLARRAGLPEQGILRRKSVRVFIYVVSTAAVLITFSRTHILTLVVGVACTVSYRSALRRLVGGGGLGLVFVLVGLGAGTYLLANARSGPLDLFLNKVANSGSEVKVRAYETFQDINNNWRGYEAYRATKTYEGYSTLDKIFGGGGGALVDLGFAMQLSTAQAFQYIPIMHNGYMYLLVKTGIAGLVLFALLVLQLLVLGRQALRLRDREALFAGLALLWTPLVMAATQGVITGIYNKGELIPILFLAGAATASYAQRRAALEAVAVQQLQQVVMARRMRMPASVVAVDISLS